MSDIFSVTRLSESQRKQFSCGIPELDEYFKRYSKNNHLKNIGKTFVLLKENLIVGYYTISMGSIDFSQLPYGHSEKIPKYPIPIARIGRLAVDLNYQNQGWGKFLLVDALRKIADANLLIATYGVVVDAKNEQAKQFYTKFGFLELKDKELCLFLPITSIPMRDEKN